jgi:hypothetical protein
MEEKVIIDDILSIARNIAIGNGVEMLLSKIEEES